MGMKDGSGDLDFSEFDDQDSEESESREESELSEERASKSEQVDSSTETDEYPYFVRRSAVMDERDNRVELHLRQKVVDEEVEFRRELAEELDVSEVSKTDAREFAILAAYKNPELVAKLMEEEGYDHWSG